MKKCPNTAAYFDSGWGFPKGLWTDMKKEIHRVEKSVLFHGTRFFSDNALCKQLETLYERHKKILDKQEKDKEGIFFEAFSHTCYIIRDLISFALQKLYFLIIKVEFVSNYQPLFTMDYITNSRNRKLKNKIHTFLARLSFNFLHLSRSLRLTSIGIALSFFSLFVSWFSIQDIALNGNAFSMNVGYIGYIVIAIDSVLCFLLLSSIGKEKLKTKAYLTFSDHTVIIASGVTLFLLTLVVFNSIRGFMLFYKDIVMGDGVIFQSIGSIFITAGGLLYYREKKQDFLLTMYVENTGASDSLLSEYEDILGKNDPDKKNMSLPL